MNLNLLYTTDVKASTGFRPATLESRADALVRVCIVAELHTFGFARVELGG
jgi:hypothetical protein